MSGRNSLKVAVFGLAAVLVTGAGALAAQQSNQQEDPLKRQKSAEQIKEQNKKLAKETSKVYKKWLDEDVRWIITDEEMQAFKALQNDEERENFIEQFWLRRDPTPDTVENEYREEHYRRIAYANERFASGIPGWRTDRGRIYVVFGPPDSIDSHPSGGSYQRPSEEGGGQTSTYPFETWRYRYLDDIGQEIELEFVDKCMCGEYKLTIDRSEKDALLNVPGAGLTMYEEMGLASKSDRFSRGGFERLGKGPFNHDQDSKQFQRLELLSKVNRAPAVKFKDLQEKVSTTIRYNLMPFDVRFDFVKTGTEVLMPITLQIKNSDMTYAVKDGIARGTVNISGQIRNMTGRIVHTFEDTVGVETTAELLERDKVRSSLFWKAFQLRPGRYRVDVVVKDVNSDRLGSWRRGIVAPRFEEDQLASSSLILADVMEKVGAKDVGAGNFVIGGTKVRPRVDAADGTPAKFKKSQQVNFWMQVYGLGVDEQTKKANADVQYQIVNATTKKEVFNQKETTAQLGPNVGEQVTLEKTFNAAGLEPGTYELTIKVDDKVSKQALAQTAKFTVEQ